MLGHVTKLTDPDFWEVLAFLGLRGRVRFSGVCICVCQEKRLESSFWCWMTRANAKLGDELTRVSHQIDYSISSFLSAVPFFFFLFFLLVSVFQLNS